MRIPRLSRRAMAATTAFVTASLLTAGTAYADPGGPGGDHGGRGFAAATPIRHLVVIIGENESFDHYFGTYPYAANTDGQPFHPAPGTPAVDGLPSATSGSLPPALRHTASLLTGNPNLAQPKRLDSSPTGLPGSAGGQLTCDQENNYGPEQAAFDGGKMDAFVQDTGVSSGTSDFGTPCRASTVMDYYDGNTVTGLWNYAQHYAMSDNSYGTTFGGTVAPRDTSSPANSPGPRSTSRCRTLRTTGCATPCTRSRPRSAAPGSTATRTTSASTRIRSSTTPRQPTRTT